jgi:transposase, IS30 family
MKKNYKHLSVEERDHLSVLKGKGLSLRAISRALKRSPSTLSRELKRNAPPIRSGYYLSHRAHQRYVIRNQQRACRLRLKTKRIRAYVGRQLNRGWSPELISGRLAHLWPKQTVSPEAIYQWVYAEATHLIPCLVRHHRRRLSFGHGHKHAKNHIPGRVSIDKRPKIINQRKQFGHWETDTMISRQSKVALRALAERQSRFAKLGKLKRKTAPQMSHSLNRTLCRFPQKVRRSLTYDNGTENTNHLETNQVLGTKSFFCAPFHSWEKGTVENTIGLVRRHLPKKTDLAKVSPKKLKSIERWLNNRPRKCLGFQTPAEVFRRSVALTG